MYFLLRILLHFKRPVICGRKSAQILKGYRFSAGMVQLLNKQNISGKNKISMSDLKVEFEGLGFTEVSTYLNSGNVVFSSETDNAKADIEKMLTAKFALEIPVYVIEMDELNDILLHSPEWWGSDDKEKCNLLDF